MLYEKQIVECGEEENLIEHYDVLVRVKFATFRRKRVTHVIQKLFKDPILRDPSGVGETGIGTVERIGSKVTDLSIGQLVIFLLPESSEQSAAGKLCIAPRYACFPCPYKVDLAEAITTVDALIPAFSALQNRVSRGDTVLVTYPYTPEGQIIIQSLYQRGCKIVLFVSKPDHMDFLGPYRRFVDHIFQGWNFRTPKETEKQLMKECDDLGYNMIIDLASNNPLTKEKLGNSEFPTFTHNHSIPLKLSSAISLLSVGGFLVLNYSDSCAVTKEMSANLYAKSATIHFLNAAANILAPNKLGSLINYLHLGLTALESKTIIAPSPIHKVYLEKAVIVLNNDQDRMDGCYVVDMDMVSNQND